MRHLRHILTVLTALFCLTATAQEIQEEETFPKEIPSLPSDSAAADCSTGTTLSLPLPDMATPFLGLSAPGFCGLSPWTSGLDGTSWRLHEGFNAQLSMSLTAAFGHNAPSGVGFGQGAAFAYAMPLSKKFAAAVGLYATNMDWGAWHQTDGGVAATLQYRLSDAVSLYAYGAKTFLPEHKRRAGYGWFYPYYLMNPDNRIGAMAEIKIGNKAMIQVSVERQGY